ncbi:hypothetical protein DESUT3_18380 [Desulfuromonas versatilis]|uniref:Peptidase M17 leucyl aminopeptidase N-terminal domain-containing protein n=1 Tax=Desulfuromonas versatilis TaxID=2802975 RepID=A0ABN6DXX7_9BACT|nr:M17 family peptidase N-terminal domain-containing protein [Desulfuromonas versatilis]BCR04769.1 hypothetical protein DESUT3_18380 [Desulfuromonas versatilis]
MNQLKVVDLPADLLAVEAVAAIYFEDERPLQGPAALLDWRLNGMLTDLLLRQEVAGHAGEHVLVASNGKIAAQWVLFVGGGKHQGLGGEAFRGLLRHLFETVREAGFRQVAVCLAPEGGMDVSDLNLLVIEACDAYLQKGLDCSLSVRPVGH